MSKKLHFSISEDFARSDIQKVKRGLPARLEHELVYAASDEEKGQGENCNFNWHV
jgi:hypothetical protein